MLCSLKVKTKSKTSKSSKHTSPGKKPTSPWKRTKMAESFDNVLSSHVVLNRNALSSNDVQATSQKSISAVAARKAVASVITIVSPEAVVSTSTRKRKSKVVADDASKPAKTRAQGDASPQQVDQTEVQTPTRRRGSARWKKEVVRPVSPSKISTASSVDESESVASSMLGSPPRRKVGRPPKNKTKSSDELDAVSSDIVPSQGTPQRKRRGRPPKSESGSPPHSPGDVFSTPCGGGGHLDAAASGDVTRSKRVRLASQTTPSAAKGTPLRRTPTPGPRKSQALLADDVTDSPVPEVRRLRSSPNVLLSGGRSSPALSSARGRRRASMRLTGKPPSIQNLLETSAVEEEKAEEKKKADVGWWWCTIM